jgi:hypothetical protein
MATEDTVLVIDPDGSATTVAWPAPEDGRQEALHRALGSAQAKMLRCGKGILGFFDQDGERSGRAPNSFATKAFAEQGIELGDPIFGPVVFARNPSKGSIVKALTDAQAANLLVVTGARLTG